MNEQVYLAHYYRCLWEEEDLFVVVGDASKLKSGFEAFNMRYNITPPEGDVQNLLQRLFAAAGLAAVSLAEREYWGWSLSIPGSTHGLFCTVEPQGMVCGRVMPSPQEKQTVVVQRRKEQSGATQSTFIMPTHDPVGAVEQYFPRCEQIPVRISVAEAGRGAFVRPCSGGGLDAVSGMSDEDCIACCENRLRTGGLAVMEEVVLFYACRCTPEHMHAMFDSLSEEDRRQLWGNASSLDVACPRCGRTHTISRAGAV